jgi:hypothetical protein
MPWHSAKCHWAKWQLATYVNMSIMMSWLGSTNTQVQRLNSESSVNEWARHELWTCEWLVNQQGMNCEWNRHELCRSTVYVYAQLRTPIKSLFTSGYKLETTSGLYYKPTMIANDDSRVINKLEASLSDDARVIIYDRHMFIVLAISHLTQNSTSVVVSANHGHASCLDYLANWHLACWHFADCHQTMID